MLTLPASPGASCMSARQWEHLKNLPVAHACRQILVRQPPATGCWTIRRLTCASCGTMIRSRCPAASMPTSRPSERSRTQQALQVRTPAMGLAYMCTNMHMYALSIVTEHCVWATSQQCLASREQTDPATSGMLATGPATLPRDDDTWKQVRWQQIPAYVPCIECVSFCSVIDLHFSYVIPTYREFACLMYCIFGNFHQASSRYHGQSLQTWLCVRRLKGEWEHVSALHNVVEPSLYCLLG